MPSADLLQLVALLQRPFAYLSLLVREQQEEVVENHLTYFEYFVNHRGAFLGLRQKQG